MIICEAGDIVEVPFPFVDSVEAKTRKAIALSTKEFNKENKTTTLMMITSAERSSWIGDVNLVDLQKAGLKKKCVARLKIFTIDNRYILKKSGHLSEVDSKNVEKSLKKYLLPRT